VQPAAVVPNTGGRAVSPNDEKATLTLDQIQPRPIRAMSDASTDAGQLPSIDAVRLYAQARIATLDGNRPEATSLLERAVALDPESFELHKSLGEVYADAGDYRALEQWEKAASIQGDHLDLQVELGARFLRVGDDASALRHLRLAVQTTDYRRDDAGAAQTDYLLGQVLQRQGYDRAALETYERLLRRLQGPHWSMRRDPRVAALAAHPDELALSIAALYEKHKAYGQAIALLEPLAAGQSQSFEPGVRLARDLLATGRRDRAIALAGELVSRFHARAESILLLRKMAGGRDEAIAILRRLHAESPQDRNFVYALSDCLAAADQSPAAAAVVVDGLRRWPDDVRLTRRHVEFLRRRHDFGGAATFLIDALARRPEMSLEVGAIWDSLTWPSAFGRLRSSDVPAGSPGTPFSAARFLLLARSARIENRDRLEHETLKEAAAIRPLFGPAWREMLGLIWIDEARTDQQKADASAQLADEAAKSGSAAFAAELRGQALLDQQKPQPAALAFAQAARLGGRSAELYLNFAAALHAMGDDDGSRSLLRKLAEERPFCADAYQELYAIHEKRGEMELAGRVVANWNWADPDSTAARRAAARQAVAEHDLASAQEILLNLLDRHDNDPDVLTAVQEFYAQTQKLDELTIRLEQRLAGETWNFNLGQELAQIYLQQQRTHQAFRVASGLHAAAAHDPDLLYIVSGLYTRMGDQERSEQALADILKLDPSYAGANNDLGYSWAEQGKKLGQAEGLIRRALAAEPDNPSFLDSLGWVLYKRGQFDEALRNLARAADPAEQADPVVLDHLGDTLYRLGQRDNAARRWQQAAQRLAERHDDTRDDLKRLKTGLLQKQRQLEAGKPVVVAPVGGNP